MYKQLKKLKLRSIREFRERGLQAGHIAAEKLGMSSQAALPGDRAFFESFAPPLRNVHKDALFKHFRGRPVVGFYPAFQKPEETIREFRNRFAEEETNVIERAIGATEGVFDLLGYKQLYFGARIPDWHYDPVSGRKTGRTHWSTLASQNEGAGADRKIIWELNRHQYFSTLGIAYSLTKDEKYAEAFVNHLTSWILENPPKIGINWLSSLEIAFRSISWIWAFHYFRGSEALSSTVFVEMLKHLYLNGCHIERFLSTYSSPNTHLTGEALGLYFLGTFLPEHKAGRRWEKMGYEILMAALDFQVRADGVYCEQSSHYHRYTTDFYLNLLILRRSNGEQIDEKHLRKLNQLLDFLLYVTQPNGETSLFGDEDGGRLHFLDARPISDFRPTLALGAVLLNRGDLKFVSQSPSTELLWLLGAEGMRQFDNLDASRPAQTVKSFDTSGFFEMRDSWGEDSKFLLIDCGVHGFLNAGHAHADALGFVLSVHGEPVFVDSGTFRYASDLKARGYFRSTAAHNCLTVNGESSSTPGGAWDWKSVANSELLEWYDEVDKVKFLGRHDGFQRWGVQYERSVVFLKRGSVTITDSIKCNILNTYELHFILSDHCEARISDQQVLIFSRDERKGALLVIETSVNCEGQTVEGSWAIEPCIISPRYGEGVASQKLIYSLRTDESFMIQNVFNPS